MLISNLSLPSNEPIKSYAPGTPERKQIKIKLKELKNRQIEIPIIIGDKEIKTGNLGQCILPHDHGTVVGTYHKAGERGGSDGHKSLASRHAYSGLIWIGRSGFQFFSGRRTYPCRALAFFVKRLQYVMSEQKRPSRLKLTPRVN